VAGVLPTVELLRDLVSREDAPWARLWGRDVAMGAIESAASDLARLLAPFRIYPRVLPDVASNWNARVTRGFAREDFEDAWSRYLPDL
jgi:hypothetical protein